MSGNSKFPWIKIGFVAAEFFCPAQSAKPFSLRFVLWSQSSCHRPGACWQSGGPDVTYWVKSDEELTWGWVHEAGYVVVPAITVLAEPVRLPLPPDKKPYGVCVYVPWQFSDSDSCQLHLKVARCWTFNSLFKLLSSSPACVHDCHVLCWKRFSYVVELRTVDHWTIQGSNRSILGKNPTTARRTHTHVCMQYITGIANFSYIWELCIHVTQTRKFLLKQKEKSET